MNIYQFNTTDKTYLKGKKIAIVIANFYQDIVNVLLSGAIKTLDSYGINENDIDIFYLPGAFEIPLMVKKLAQKKQNKSNASADYYQGMITLGAVIKGETPHFDFVAGQCAKGVAQISCDYNIPIAFGVLTTDNMAQTLNRAGGKKGNKGVEATLAMIEMIFLLEKSN